MWEDLGAKAIFALGDMEAGMIKTSGATDKLNAQYNTFGAFFSGVWREAQVAILPVGEKLLGIANDAMPQVKEAIGWVASGLPAVVDVGVGALQRAVDVGTSLYETGRLLITGDYRSGIFGLNEDHPTINALFLVRENALQVWDAFKTGYKVTSDLIDRFDLGTPILVGVATVLGGVVLAGLISVTAAAVTAAAPFLALGAAAAVLYKAWNSNMGGIQDKTAVAFDFVRDRFEDAKAFFGRYGGDFLTIGRETFGGLHDIATGNVGNLATRVNTIVGTDLVQRGATLFGEFKDKSLTHVTQLGIDGHNRLLKLKDDAGIALGLLVGVGRDKAVELKDRVFDGVKTVADVLLNPFRDAGSKIGAVMSTFIGNIARPLNSGLRNIQSFYDGFRNTINKFSQAFTSSDLVPAFKVPTIPGYHTGTSYHPGGPAIVDERGKEPINIPGVGWVTRIDEGPGFLPNLPRGSSVMPHGAASRMLDEGMGNWGGALYADPFHVLEGARWRDGIIPFKIDPGVPNKQRIYNAVQHYASHTAIRMNELGPNDPKPEHLANTLRMLSFRSHPSENVFHGFEDGIGLIKIQPDVPTGVVIHEIGHALGLQHEQKRNDRDKYVRILWENIVPGNEDQFSIRPGSRDIGAYDLNSIMHYGPTAFSKNGLPTIEPLHGATIGQRSTLSAGDIAGIRSIYGTTPAKQAKEIGHDTGFFDPITGALSGIWNLLSGGADAAINAGLGQFGVSFELPGMLAPLASGVMSKARSMAVDWLTGASAGAGGEPYMGGGIQAAIRAMLGGGVVTNHYWNANAGPSGGIHGGTDFGGVPAGTPIRALFGGQATPGYDSVGGNWDIITNPSGQKAYYGHAMERMRAGLVKAGEVIGRVGWTGLVIPQGPGGAHVHFQMTGPNGGAWGDPEVLLGGAPVVQNNSGRTKAFANGGLIDQMIWGIGKDGTRYTLGERGPEYVIPADRMQTVPSGAAAGGDVYNEYYQIEARYDKVQPEYELRHLLTKLKMGKRRG